MRTNFFRLLKTIALGALSKSLATLATQPLIVAKVGLQSRPPPSRNGKPFKSFGEVMRYIIEHEGPMALFKGIGPQILKGLLVQGLLMMTKERYVLHYLLIFYPISPFFFLFLNFLILSIIWKTYSYERVTTVHMLTFEMFFF
jgi:hypothetical protein